MLFPNEIMRMIMSFKRKNHFNERCQHLKNKLVLKPMDWVHMDCYAQMISGKSHYLYFYYDNFLHIRYTEFLNFEEFVTHHSSGTKGLVY